MFLIASTGCAGRPPAQPAGVLTVGVSTTGAGAAALTFAVDVSSARPDAGPSLTGRAKADGGIATFRDLTGAPYVVRLTLPAQCEADGGPSRRVVVAARRTTAVRFAVRCR
jgi:hypothetical protein